MFSGALGSPKGKAVGYALIEATPTTFSWSAALEDDDGPPMPIDRYLIKFDRASRKISPPEPIVLSETELAEAIFAATGQHLASSTRFTDGALSISYKVTVQESLDIAYVVQLRHHGRVSSMDSIMTLISRTVDHRILPVPPVYPIPGEWRRQETTGMGRQITRLIPGVMASSVYPQLSHNEKLVFVQKMAVAFQACWQIQLPEDHLIGELTAATIDGRVVLKIEPDRHCSLGGPFASVREYLRAYIRFSLAALEKQQGIEDYKEQFLERIRDIVDNHLHEIPAIVEDIPIVAMHADMGLHNIIVSAQSPTEIQAVIDWEFVSSAPYASLYRIIEMLFREPALNEFGPEYDRADELRKAFWAAIHDWEQWNQSEATQAFLEWFRFGLFMKPEWRPKDLSPDEKRDFWQENIRVVERILSKHLTDGEPA
ncbi:hypothetical protein J3459_016544 [Metarhizium acridum]|uniref:Aminoglycoside phosphotransferase domain-containing protein n=1 Tax=Metarhizium acridum (strain CQMa 102) TaxID=655827 RepID=E9DSH8_METAQ|nr:uncharacterized protein MAC_00576 [Metarhizium acridum CQMa 102]EFY93338.1 hypothetical protein MAC_00576 [Metarhizium acridum CQMa 102]KAG8411199.1 hypothetical protein J3459_016544 [Metarhizium acridum]